MNTTEQHRREIFSRHGWNLADDDTPQPPEPSPLDSAQWRRYVREAVNEPLHSL